MPSLTLGVRVGREVVFGRQLTWVWGLMNLLSNPPTQPYEGDSSNGFVFPRRSYGSKK